MKNILAIFLSTLVLCGAYNAYTVISSTPNIRIEYVSFGGASEPSVCASDPCTIYRKSAAISTVNKSATGQYKIVFSSGTFSAIPECSGIGDNGAGADFVTRDRAYASSVTEIGLRTISDAGSSTNSSVDAICVGPR